MALYVIISNITTGSNAVARINAMPPIDARARARGISNQPAPLKREIAIIGAISNNIANVNRRLRDRAGYIRRRRRRASLVGILSRRGCALGGVSKKSSESLLRPKQHRKPPWRGNHVAHIERNSRCRAAASSLSARGSSLLRSTSAYQPQPRQLARAAKEIDVAAQ